jgi:AraC-like DNA-binding protein
VRELARRVGLSESRFTHLFREQLGLTLGGFMKWRRMNLALVAIAEGGTFTDAALAAGFHDSAHFTHTFVELFGGPPSDVFTKADTRMVNCTAEASLHTTAVPGPR